MCPGSRVKHASSRRTGKLVPAIERNPVLARSVGLESVFRALPERHRRETLACSAPTSTRRAESASEFVNHCTPRGWTRRDSRRPERVGPKCSIRGSETIKWDPRLTDRRRLLPRARLISDGDVPSSVMHAATKAQRRAARERVSAHYEAELATLVGRVEQAVARYRAGKIDILDVDDVIHRYSNAARELWKFCWSQGAGSHAVFVARTLELWAAEADEVDLWGEAERRRRRR